MCKDGYERHRRLGPYGEEGFRHLPVMDENHDIAGILDITKCFYDAMEKLERAYSSSRKLYDALEGVQAELGSSQPQQIIQYVEALRSKMSGPTLESVLTGLPPTVVTVRTSVKDAAALMKENHTTAVLVQDQGTDHWHIHKQGCSPPGHCSRP